MDFEYRKNSDGSWGIYNSKVEDIYFSNIGAHKEAMEKFVIPSDVASFDKDKKIKILDVCYGMGFNSKSFVDYCIKNNFKFEYEIDCIEIDKNILALGLLIFDKNISNDIHLIFGKKILDAVNLDENIENILGENWIKLFLDDFQDNFKQLHLNFGVDLYITSKNKQFLHNIYYQNQSNNNIFIQNLSLSMILNDLLATLPLLHKKYDLIFHDAFSIRKQPDMWSEEVFKEYYRLLAPSGKLLTYSNSRVVRRTLENIGFEVKINYNNLEKQNGTIAIKT